MEIRCQLQNQKAKLIKKISDIENKDRLTRQELRELTRLHTTLRWINKGVQAHG